MNIDDNSADADGHASEGRGGEAAVAIIVCSSCRDASGSDARPRPGEQLADNVRAAAAGNVRVETVECLGNCKRRLSAAIVKDGAWSYVFGDLTPESAADLVAGASLFAQSDGALLPWRGRPASLKQGLVARIPPISFRKDTRA